ncbi:MAG: hypothetical protein CMO99_05060 [Woeseiaceae bacterium]|nr:hypothetical protein [Woeseiaceae bacterium]|tara:strand:- start:47 stop:436 length:390 start_codon:yes stop_codon:yes gene_type:complete
MKLLKNKQHDLYNTTVMDLFYRSRYCENNNKLKGVSIECKKSDVATGSILKLICKTENNKISSARYQVYGCPYLMASAEWLCETVQGKSASQLKKLKIMDLMKILSIPTERKSIILILEDVVDGIRLQL